MIVLSSSSGTIDNCVQCLELGVVDSIPNMS